MYGNLYVSQWVVEVLCRLKTALLVEIFSLKYSSRLRKLDAQTALTSTEYPNLLQSSPLDSSLGSLVQSVVSVDGKSAQRRFDETSRRTHAKIFMPDSLINLLPSVR